MVPKKPLAEEQDDGEATTHPGLPSRMVPVECRECGNAQTVDLPESYEICGDAEAPQMTGPMLDPTRAEPVKWACSGCGTLNVHDYAEADDE